MAHYRIAFRKGSNLWWKLNNGVLTTDTVPYYLDASLVSDWEKLGVTDERNMRLVGFTRKYSASSYQFVLDAKEIVTQIVNKYGSQATCILWVELDKVFDYEIALNLSTAVQSQLHVDVEVMEDDIPALVKSREDVEYEIPIWGNSNRKIATINSFRVLGRFRYLSGWPIRAQGTNTNSFTTTSSLFKIAQTFVDKTIVSVSDTPSNQPISLPDPAVNHYIVGQDYENITGGGSYANAGNFLFKANIAIKNVVIKTSIPFYVDNHSGTAANFVLYISKMSVGGVTTPIFSATSASISGGTSLNFTLELDNTTTPFDLAAGEIIVLEAGMNNVSAQNIDIAWEKSRYLDVNFEHYTNDFEVLGFPVYYVGQRLIDMVTDGKATLASNLLTSNSTYEDGIDLRIKDVLILSGNSIRQTDDASIKISLKNYLKFLDSVCCVGLDVDGTTVRIEKKSDLLKPSEEIADLGDVIDNPEKPGFKRVYATDLVYNEIHIGSKEYTYDDINGKDEPNTIAKYLTPVTTDKNILDLTSPIRLDGYGIFYTWVQTAFQKNKDNAADNTLFALQVVGTPYATGSFGISKHMALYPKDINGGLYAIGGVLEPGRLLNSGMTPRKCIERHNYWIASLFYGNDNDYLKFQTSQKNHNLVSRISTTQAFVENANILISDLGDRLFFPWYLEFNIQSPKNYLSLFAAKKFGYFKCKWQGHTHKGYSIKTESENAKPKVHNFKLLVTKDDSPQNW